MQEVLPPPLTSTSAPPPVFDGTTRLVYIEGLIEQVIVFEHCFYIDFTRERERENALHSFIFLSLIMGIFSFFFYFFYVADI